MIATLLIAFFSLIVLMIIHEYGHFVIAKKFGVKVEEFGIGYPPRIFGRKFGETLYSVNLIPLGAFVRIYGEEGGVDDYRSFSNLKIYKRVLICLGGVLAFWIAAAVIFSIAFFLGASVPIGDQDIAGVQDTAVQVMDVAQDSPALQTGLKAGDILAKGQGGDGEFIAINKVSDFQKFVDENRGKEIHLTILRNGQTVQTKLTPRVSYPEGQGPSGLVLERFARLIEKKSWHEAPIQGMIFTGKVTWDSLAGIYNFFAGLFAGKGVPKEAQLAGPVGITIFLSQAATLGAGFFLYFIGSLTVLLAIFNLFPIPALDGGKLIFLAIEKIMKKPVPVNWEQGLTIFFFVLLISMSLFVTIKFDIPRVMEFWRAGL